MKLRKSDEECKQLSSRRNFLKAGSILLAALLLPINLIMAKTKKIAFSLNKVKKLKKIGGWAILKIKGNHILFIRDTKESVKAVNSVCTHKKCTVEYNRESKKISCPCHGSEFHTDGKVLTPPAKEPLKSYPVTLSDGKVVITIEE